jgi:hypothetical protein
MRIACWLVVLALANFCAGCKATVKVGEAPAKVSYLEWAEKMAGIPEVVKAEEFVEAALVRHRNSNKVDEVDARLEELRVALWLLGQAADQYYEAWRRHPQYEQFILMELDKVYGYIHTCIIQRPYFIEPIDPLNIYGGALTYEQRQKMEAYQTRLKGLSGGSGD